jgi:hypothetical protein
MDREAFERMLDDAGEAAEHEADDAAERALIDERLHALGAGPDPSEAERLAAQAAPPRERSDGKIVGLAGKPARPLTPQQMAYVNGVIQGKSRKAAYREAYPAAQGTDATIAACAARLSRDPRVQRLIAAGWEETTEALAEDAAAVRRYVSRSLVALSKAGQSEQTRLRALELLGRTAGSFKDSTASTAAPVTAEQLRAELSTHLRLLAGGKA